MKDKLLVFTISLLVGGVVIFGFVLLFPRTMTNEEVIKQTKLCHEADMKVERIVNFVSDTVKIICVPKDEQ